MRVWLTALSAALLLVPVSPAPAAEEEEPVTLSKEEIKLLKQKLGDEEKAKVLHEKLDKLGPKEKHEKGMFDRALDLGIWTLVVFLVLLGVLSKYAWGPLLEGLEKREKDIALAVEDARKAREDAAAARQQVAEEQARSHDRARQIVEDARRSAEEGNTRREAEFQAKMAEERDRFHREMTIAKDQAVKEMMTQAANLAALVSSKAIRRNLTPDDHRGLVDEALNDINRAFEERRRALSGGAN